MPTYLIGDGECEFKEKQFYLVDAPTREEAIALFARKVEIHDETWTQWIYDRVINESFAERFWLSKEANPGYEYDRQLHCYVATQEQFEENVRRFFGPHLDFAQIYLDIWRKSEETMMVGEFPTEMQVYMCLNGNWCMPIILELGDIEGL